MIKKTNPFPIFFDPNRRDMLRWASGLVLGGLSLPENLHAAEPGTKKLNKNNFSFEFGRHFIEIQKLKSESEKVSQFVNLANAFAKEITKVFPNDHNAQVNAYGSILASAEKLIPSGFVKYGYYLNDFLLENYLLNRDMTLEKLGKDFKFPLEKLEIVPKLSKKPTTVKADQLHSLREIVKGSALQDKLEGLAFDVCTLNREDAPFSAAIDEKSNSIIINSKYTKGGQNFTVEEDLQMSIANEALHLFLRSVYGTEFSEQKLKPEDYFSIKVGNQNIQFQSLHNAEEFLSDAASIIENPYYMSALLGVNEQNFVGPYGQSYRIARALINQLAQSGEQFKYIDPQYKGPFPVTGIPKITEAAKNTIRTEYTKIAREVLQNIIQIKEAKLKN